MPTKILITGGAGFIGSNLTHKLVELGFDVTILDNLSTGKKENLNQIINKINLIEGDVIDHDTLDKALKDIDYVFHLAALPSVQRSIDNPLESFTNNANGTINLLVASKKAGVKKIIYSASSSAYGNRRGKTKKEHLRPQPLNPYAVSKLGGEYLMKGFSHSYGLPTVCLRYFNVFGPGQDPSSPYSAVIPRFITSILKNESPEIYGDGTQSRDFTFIDNVVNANILALKSDKVKMGESINIAGGKNFSLLDIINLINKKLDKNIQPIFKPARIGDIKHSLADINKAKKLINYEPTINFEQGLEQTIEYYKQKYYE